jgi:muconolactone D-isomerase
MLFHVRMQVKLPHGLPPAEADRLKATEKARALDLQREGKWLHLWRIAGAYANVSIFDVADADELHAILTGLPLFPFMEIEIDALCVHPSSLEAAGEAR